MASPLQTISKTFGDKKKLVSEVEAFTKNEDLWLGRLNGNKGLAHVSNAKLLRLHTTFSAVKEKFGTRAKLIDAILEVEKRTKDDGFKTRLGAFPVPRLWDMYNSAFKRSQPKKKPAKTAPKAAAPKAAAAKKASAKAGASGAGKKSGAKAGAKGGAKKSAKAGKK